MTRAVRVVTIGKEFRFEAAHVLPNHKGKCAQPHGHSYRFIVELSGPVSTVPGASDEGMVVDFGDVSAVWKGLEPRIDHRDLNQALPASYHPTTAENIARYLVDYFRDNLERDDADLFVDSVTVWETATSWARAR